MDKPSEETKSIPQAASEFMHGLGDDEDLITCLWCGQSTRHETAVGACCWETWKREIDDLSALVRQLATLIRRTNPRSTSAERAIGYLKRHNLQGSPMR